ncbi:MAG: hypothetical protein EZS28_029429 [Streblomastix strix]|uniref:Uncharacterized protein n=1 Tax=Streblomastix strix TaxID=222440 RepID=A0A5J4UZ87_9EUKA|nr:MAG: hypothetical protein EZS28_029429 [Streblomastix strix]
MLGAQVIARSDTANKDAIGITNLLFGIQQLGKARVKTKRFRQLAPSAIWKQVMRPMLNQNEIPALAQKQEIQIRIQDDMPPPNSGPRDQPPPIHELYAQRNAAIPQSTIFPSTLNAKQESPKILNVLTKETIKDHMHKWMQKGFDLIRVSKDDEGHYWPGFGPGVPHATDWRKTKQQGQTQSMDEFRAFWREYNFDLSVACVRRDYDLEDDSEILQPTKTTRREFRNKFGRNRNRSLSPHNKRSRYDSNDRGLRIKRKIRIKKLFKVQRTLEFKINCRQRLQWIRDQDRYREAQKYNPYTKQAFNKTKNPINWNKTHQYEGECWDDNPNDDWTKRTQMQKDPPDNHSDKDSTWSEDEAPQHHATPPQPKQPIQQTQRVQQIQVQPKQQAPALVPKKKGRKEQSPNQDDIDVLEIIQERLAALQKENKDLSIPDSDSDCTGMNKDKSVIQSQLSVTPTQNPQHRSGMRQGLKKAERELELLKTKKQLRQQENNDLNNINVEMPDIHGTVGQLTCLQPSPSAEVPCLNAGLKPKEAGSISASNRERTEPQINEGYDDNANEEEDEQIDEAALNQQKDYRVNTISQAPVQENLSKQSQNIQGLNALNQMEKDDAGPAPVGVQEKPKKGKRSKKAKTEGLNASVEQNQGNNAQYQTNTASKVPRPKAVPKKARSS